MNFGIESIKVITHLILNDLDVSHLELSKNHIGDEGIIILSECLAKNSTIIHLDLA